MVFARTFLRVKLNVFILGRELRSDGVRVRVFKQTKSGSSWVDSEASSDTARQLEDAILTCLIRAGVRGGPG